MHGCGHRKARSLVVFYVCFLFLFCPLGFVRGSRLVAASEKSALWAWWALNRRQLWRGTRPFHSITNLLGQCFYHSHLPPPELALFNLPSLSLSSCRTVSDKFQDTLLHATQPSVQSLVTTALSSAPFRRSVRRTPLVLMPLSW